MTAADIHSRESAPTRRKAELQQEQTRRLDETRKNEKSVCVVAVSVALAPASECEPDRGELLRDIAAGIAYREMQTQTQALAERQRRIFLLREQARGVLAGNSQHFVSSQQ